MKKTILLTLLTSSSLISQAQTTYNESETPANLPLGIFYQEGPGSNNASYNWSAPYSTKLSVNKNSGRNFEISSIAKDNEGFKVRQFSTNLNDWTIWRNLILDDGYGKILLDPKGAAVKDYFGFKVTEAGNTTTKFHIFRNFTNDAQDISRMVIDADGNVGIGTTTPAAKLDVNGNIRVTSPGGYWITGKTGTGGITSSTPLTTSSYHPLLRQETASGHVINLGGLGDNFGFFGFDQARTANGFDHTLIMDLNTGNVGIGTTNPAKKLDVNGDIKLNKAIHGGYGETLFKISGQGQNTIEIYGNTHTTRAGEIAFVAGDATGSNRGGFTFFQRTSTNSFNPLIRINKNGNVAVYGKLEAKELKVTLTPTADFVFAENYDLPSLDFIENHIKKHKHLPEIASAKEMMKDGVNVGEFQIKLLQKVEEITLYTIAQEKKIEEQTKEIEKLKLLSKRLEKIEKQLDSKK